MLLAYAMMPEPDAVQAQVRPNIVLILADDMREDDLLRLPKTRNLLVDKGITFENAFVATPQCCPSRTSILTGEYAHNHRILGNAPSIGGFATFHKSGLESRTVGTRLKRNGYRTAFFGKLLNGYCEHHLGCKTGRDYVPSGWSDWHAWSGPTMMNDDGATHKFDQPLVRDDVVKNRVANVFDSWDGKQPLFMHVSTKAPHTETAVAKRHAGLYAGEHAPRGPAFGEKDLSDKPSYVRSEAPLTDGEVARIDKHFRYRLRTLRAVDDLVGRIVRELAAKGELDNTYVFFASDNGYMMGEHGLYLRKGVPYDESIGIPLVVRGPGVPSGRAADELIVNTDLAPTFEDLAGLSPEGDGRSVVPLLRGYHPPWREAFLLESWREATKGTARGELYYLGVRTANHLYVRHHSGAQELYDLREDPWQLENVYDTADRSVKLDLAAKLEALRSCEGTECSMAEGF